MQIPDYVLKVSTAKHFGHWQVARISDPYLKGFTWTALAGSWMDSDSKIGQLLRSGYNRREENILINHMINWDGTHQEDVFKRDVMFENPCMLVKLPPEYHVPNDPSLTPWQLIKDVSRRYPDYILKVAQYGFPYEAEATLVFAHPLD
jgi:hypothetical protein